MTSRDVTNPQNLGYTYEYESDTPNKFTDNNPSLYVPQHKEPAPVLAVSNINRSAIGGSCMITAFAKSKTGEQVLAGTEAVLSR